MPLDTNNTALYLQCDVKFGLWDGETPPTTFEGPVNFEKVTITSPTQDNQKLISNMLGDYGQPLGSVFKPKDVCTIKCEFSSMSPTLLNALLSADAKNTTQTAAAVSGETVNPSKTVWNKFASTDIAAHGTGTEIVFKDADEEVIPLLNFELDLTQGLYRSLTTLGTTATKVSYHKAATTRTGFDAGKIKSYYMQMLITGIEKISGKVVAAKIHKASVTPSSSFDPVSGGFIKGALSGDLLTPTTETSPWYFTYLSV
jgi:hypothetical protein